MNLRNVLVMAGAILSIALSGVLLSMFLGLWPWSLQDLFRPRADLVDVLVAGQDLDSGTVLDVRRMFVIKPMLKSEADAGPHFILRSPQDLQDQLLLRPLAKGQPCTLDHLKGGTVLAMASVKPENRATLGQGTVIDLLFVPRQAEQKPAQMTARIRYLQDHPGTDGAGLLLSLIVNESDAKRIRTLVAAGQHTALVEAKRP